MKHKIKNLGIHVDSLIMYEYRGRKLRKNSHGSYGVKPFWRTYDNLSPAIRADTRKELINKIDEFLK